MGDRGNCYCAIVRNAAGLGSLWCWGYDRASGVISNSVRPRRVSGLPGNVTDVALGKYHACALVDNNANSTGGNVFCWGTNRFGQLGQGYCNDSKSGTEDLPVVTTPTRIQGLDRARALIAGVYDTCAVTASHKVFCWGFNRSGQLSVARGAIDPVCSSGGAVVPYPAAMVGVCMPL